MKKVIQNTILILLIFISPPLTSYGQVNIDSGIVAYYSFNGNANDESGSENHGTVIGATLYYDRSGNPNSSYYFDGITNKIKKKGTLVVKNGKIYAKSKFEISLKDYNIKIPNLVKDKVSEIIPIDVNMVYEPYNK